MRTTIAAGARLSIRVNGFSLFFLVFGCNHA